MLWYLYFNWTVVDTHPYCNYARQKIFSSRIILPVQISANKNLVLKNDFLVETASLVFQRERFYDSLMSGRRRGVFATVVPQYANRI